MLYYSAFSAIKASSLPLASEHYFYSCCCAVNYCVYTLCQQQSKTRTFCKNGPIWCSQQSTSMNEILFTWAKNILSHKFLLLHFLSHCKSIKNQISSCFTLVFMTNGFGLLLMHFCYFFSGKNGPFMKESCFFSVNVLLLTTEVEKIIIIMQKKLHQEKPICSSSHIQLHSGVHYYPFLGFLRAQNYLSLFLQHIGSSQGTVNTSTELCIEKLLIFQTLKYYNNT